MPTRRSAQFGLPVKSRDRAGLMSICTSMVPLNTVLPQVSLAFYSPNHALSCFIQLSNTKTSSDSDPSALRRNSDGGAPIWPTVAGRRRVMP